MSGLETKLERRGRDGLDMCREVSNKSQRIHWTKNVEYAAERQEEKGKTSEVYGNSEGIHAESWGDKGGGG